MNKNLLTVLGLVFLFGLMAGVAYYAETPSRLDRLDQMEAQKPDTIKVQEATNTPQPEPPPPAQEDLMASLRPESLTNAPADLGLGVGFGSGGGGPAIGGQGGFGGDANQAVQQATAVDRPVRVAAKTPLEFPQEARQRGVSGYVILKIFVSEAGAIQRIDVQESEPAGVFDQAAIHAIRSWRFEPALNKGKTIAATTLQRVRFELN